MKIIRWLLTTIVMIDDCSLAHDLHLIGNLGKRNLQAVFRIRDSVVYGPLDSALFSLLSPIGGSEGECS